MGKNCLTRSPCHVLSRLSRPPRGAVMRRRESGAGCGTRERGKRKPRPRAALGKPPRGTKTAGSVRLAENAKAVMPRGAPGRRGRTRHVRQGPGDPGPPEQSGRSGEIQAMRLLGAPLPSWGKGKGDGQTPSPTKPGADETCCLTIGYVFLRSPPRKRGPRSQNCRWKEWVPAFAGTSGRDIRCRPRRARPGTVPKAVFIAVPDLPRTTSAVFVTGHTDELGTLVLHRVRDTHADFRLSARPPQAGTQAFRQRVRPWAP